MKNIDTYFIEGFYLDGSEYFESGFNSKREALDEVLTREDIMEFYIFVRYNDGREEQV